jgi:hypothetical protein
MYLLTSVTCVSKTVENLQEKLRILGINHITLYIWLGTCDLTVKSDQFIKICSENFSAVHCLCKGLKDIVDYIRQFPTITLVYLEIPYYSIRFYSQVTRT